MPGELLETFIKAAAHGIRICLTPVVIDEAVEKFSGAPPRSQKAEQRRSAEKQQSLFWLATGGLLVVGAFVVIVFV
jgi:hypothetical protein